MGRKAFRYKTGEKLLCKHTRKIYEVLGHQSSYNIIGEIDYTHRNKIIKTKNKDQPFERFDTYTGSAWIIYTLADDEVDKGFTKLDSKLGKILYD